MGVSSRSFGVIRERLDDLAAHRGETEVLQYTGMKWTILDVKKYADAMASGLHEISVKEGDAVASLVAADMPESHCGQICAAAAGYVYVQIDPALGPEGVSVAASHRQL